MLSEVKGNHPRSTMIGKIKTTLLSITLILIYIPITSNKITIIFIASIITMIFQVITLIKYISIDIDKDKKKKKSNK